MALEMFYECAIRSSSSSVSSVGLCSILLTDDLYMTDLTDDIELCGDFLVWLTKKRDDRFWLSGLFFSATCDADELLESA